MIDKTRNVTIQVTFPKNAAKALQSLREAFAKNGIRVSKSDILLQAFRDYLMVIMAAGRENQAKNQEEN